MQSSQNNRKKTKIINKEMLHRNDLPEAPKRDRENNTTNTELQEDTRIEKRRSVQKDKDEKKKK